MWLKVVDSEKALKSGKEKSPVDAMVTLSAYLPTMGEETTRTGQDRTTDNNGQERGVCSFDLTARKDRCGSKSGFLCVCAPASLWGDAT